MAEHLPFLIAAYAVVWIGVLLYVAGLARRSRNLEREIDELRTFIDARHVSPAPPSDPSDRTR